MAKRIMEKTPHIPKRHKMSGKQVKLKSLKKSQPKKQLFARDTYGNHPTATA